MKKRQRKQRIVTQAAQGFVHLLRGGKESLSREEGQALVLLAGGLVAIMGFVGMSVDVGNLVYTRTDLQKVADAAALAAAQDLPTANASMSVADAYITANGGADCQPACASVSPGGGSITVVASRRVEYYFMRVLGFDGADVSATATARTISVTGYNFDNEDIFPYAVWGGNPSWPNNCTADYGICVGATKTYRSNQWDNQVANSQKQNGAWSVPGNNFKGYFNVSQSGQIYQADPYRYYSFGGNAVGQQPIDALHAHYVSGRPVILPVVTRGNCTNNCGTLNFTIVGWVALKLTVDPLTTNGDFKGTVVGNMISTKGVGGGYQAGNGYPAIKTISLIE